MIVWDNWLCYNIQFEKLPTLQMNGIPLRSVEKIKYLGVYVNNKLSRHDHITYICNKANQLLGFLKRNLYSCHRSMLTNNSCYHHLSIAVPSGTHIVPSKLEMVQHRAACFVLNKPWNRHHHNNITEI